MTERCSHASEQPFQPTFSWLTQRLGQKDHKLMVKHNSNSKQPKPGCATMIISLVDGNRISASSEIQERVLTQRGCSNYNPPAIFCFLRTSGNGGVCVLTPESTTQNPAVSARKSSKSATRILSFTSKEHNWKHWVLKLQVQLLPK